LARPVTNQELRDAGRLGFLDRVMNERLVNDREHFLGYRLGRRQEPGAQTGDWLERLAQVIDFEVYRSDVEAALSRSDRTKGGRPPYDPVLMI
jgi:hypothetical protein